MDKHWKDVKVGDMIEIHNRFYKLCEGEFEIATSKFYGKYFKFIGATYKKVYDSGIWGYEILEETYKIIDKLPDNLYK